jgi:hypothetical protein
MRDFAEAQMLALSQAHALAQAQTQSHSRAYSQAYSQAYLQEEGEGERRPF